jgi:hypothetical protein
MAVDAPAQVSVNDESEQAPQQAAKSTLPTPIRQQIQARRVKTPATAAKSTPAKKASTPVATSDAGVEDLLDEDNVEANNDDEQAVADAQVEDEDAADEFDVMAMIAAQDEAANMDPQALAAAIASSTPTYLMQSINRRGVTVRVLVKIE